MRLRDLNSGAHLLPSQARQGLVRVPLPNHMLPGYAEHHGTHVHMCTIQI